LRHRDRRIGRRATSLIAVLIVATQFGQSASGELWVTVRDATGLPVGCRVMLTSEANDISQALQTNAAGESLAKRLPFGRYRVTVDQPGFSRYDAPVDVDSVGVTSTIASYQRRKDEWDMLAQTTGLELTQRSPKTWNRRARPGQRYRSSPSSSEIVNWPCDHSQNFGRSVIDRRRWSIGHRTETLPTIRTLCCHHCRGNHRGGPFAAPCRRIIALHGNRRSTIRAGERSIHSSSELVPIFDDNVLAACQEAGLV